MIAHEERASLGATLAVWIGGSAILWTGIIALAMRIAH